MKTVRSPIRLEQLRVGNAACILKHMNDIKVACVFGATTEITIGSITHHESPGNVGRVYAYDPETGVSVNALGLPNPGLGWYLKNMPQIRATARATKKILRASIVGSSPVEFADMAGQLLHAGVDIIEVNMGCPNVWHQDGTRKPIISYDPLSVAEVLAAINHAVGRNIPIAVKISPVPDDILPALTKTIVESGIVSEVVAVNTLPSYQMTVNGKPALQFRGHKEPSDAPIKDMGGGAGTILKDQMLRVVEFLSTHLPVEIDITAVGGIMNGKDLYDAYQLGASGFQCATAYIENGGPDAISQILQEFAALLPEDVT